MKQRWIIAGLVAWGLAIGGLGYYSVRTDPSTAREQTTVADALPTVDDALARVAAALDPAATVPVLNGYHLISTDCRVTSVRDGARYERVLTVYTREGAEPALLDRIAAGLPSSYRTLVRHQGPVHTLDADAGNFVVLRGGLEEPGQLRLSADTGCRPPGRIVGELAGSAVSGDPAQPVVGRDPAQAVLDRLGLTASFWRTRRVPCPAGGDLQTVEAITGPGAASSVGPSTGPSTGPNVAPPSMPAVLPDAVRANAPGAAVVLSRPEVYAYRTGSSGVAVRVAGAALIVSATTGC